MNDLKDAIKDRLGHPIIGTFTIFMIVFNWKYFLLIFTGSTDAVNRILAITKNYEVEGVVYCWPVFLTLLYPVVGGIADLAIHYKNIFFGNLKNRFTEKHDSNTNHILSMVRDVLKSTDGNLKEVEAKIKSIVDNKGKFGVSEMAKLAEESTGLISKIRSRNTVVADALNNNDFVGLRGVYKDVSKETNKL